MRMNSFNSLQHTFIQVSKTHRNQIHALLAEKQVEVYPGQPPLLFALSRQDGQSQRELADSLQIKPATLTIMLNRMGKAGLIERQPDEKDQRVSRIYVTAKGKQAHEEVKAALKTVETTCFHGFTLEEKDLLQALLLRMYDNLHAPSQPQQTK